MTFVIVPICFLISLRSARVYTDNTAASQLFQPLTIEALNKFTRTEKLKRNEVMLCDLENITRLCEAIV